MQRLQQQYRQGAVVGQNGAGNSMGGPTNAPINHGVVVPKNMFMAKGQQIEIKDVYAENLELELQNSRGYPEV